MDFLKKLRAVLGLSPAELATLLSVHRATIYAWEAISKVPRALKIHEILLLVKAQEEKRARELLSGEQLQQELKKLAELELRRKADAFDFLVQAERYKSQEAHQSMRAA